jgi:hypothetical protein
MATTKIKESSRCRLKRLVGIMAEEIRRFSQDEDFHCCVQQNQENCRGCYLDALLLEAKEACKPNVGTERPSND